MALVLAIHFIQYFYFVALFFGGVVTAQRTPLYLLILLPYPDPDVNSTLQPSWNEGPNIAPVVELAVEQINNDSNILPGYELKLIHDDSGCEIVSRTFVSFVRGIATSDTPPVGIIGPGCSVSSLRTSSLNGRDEIALINVHLAGSPLLGNRTTYPNSFGPLGSTDIYVDTTFALMRNNSWKCIAALFDESRVFFSSTFETLERNITSELPDSKIAFSSAVYETNLPLKPIRDSLLRIITVFAGPELTRRIMCLAYYEEMMYPAYQWILFGREISEFVENGATEFDYDGRRYNCSAEVMLNTVLRGHLLVNYKLSRSDRNITTFSGISYDQYLQLYQKRLDQMKPDSYFNVSVNIFATLAFDGVWALATALNRSGLNLSDYQFGNPSETDMIREHMYQLDFQGVSGPVKFDRHTGFINRPANIFQVFNANEKLVASVNGTGDLQELNFARIISDTFESASTVVLPPVAALFIVLTLTLFGLIFAAHMATIIYRSNHSLKASSVKLNHLIYIGCYIFICGTLLYEFYKAIPQVTDKVAGNICHSLWSWLLPIGITLIFGTIIARTWRLYQIFTNYLDPRPVSNSVLCTFVGILLFFDIVIGSLWTAIDPLYVEVKRKSVPSENGFMIELERACTGAKYYFAWFAVIFGYKALLLIAMTALSLLTRNIISKDFTTKSLRVLVYLLGMVFTLGLLFYWILLFQGVNVHIYYVVLSLILNTVLFLCFSLVFVPPLITTLKEKIKRRSSITNRILPSN